MSHMNTRVSLSFLFLAVSTAPTLATGKHVVTVRVAAREDPASSNGFVQIVGFAAE